MLEDNSPESADLREARAAAMNYLARREHSCRELEIKLIKRGIEPGVAADVVARLRSENLVSDTRFAEAYARSRANRLFGPMKIRAELRQRGIDDGLIEAALDDFSGSWQNAANTWADKRVAGELDRKAQARIYRSGTNRGFSHEHMMRALERLKSAD